jgi:hypothetical protein
MMTFTVVLSTQMHNTGMRSSKLIIKSNAQKQIVSFDFAHNLRDLN